MPTNPRVSAGGRLNKLIAEKEHDLDALYRTRDLLYGVVSNGKVHRGARELEAALELDTERRSARPKKKHGGAVPGSKGGAYGKKKKKDRAATALFLKKVAASDEPYKVTEKDKGRTSVLIQHGYIKAQGEGYIATGKVFTP